jgi:hypothetical protein
MLSDVVCDPADVGIIECRVNFIQDKERRRLIAVNSKEQRKSRHGFLSARQLVHVSETFHRRHGVVLDPAQVWFLRMERSEDDFEDVMVPTSLSSSERYATPPTGAALPLVRFLYTSSMRSAIWLNALLKRSHLPKVDQLFLVNQTCNCHTPLLLDSQERISSLLGFHSNFLSLGFDRFQLSFHGIQSSRLLSA